MDEDLEWKINSLLAQCTVPEYPWGRISLQKKWVPGGFSGGKCGRCVRLTTLPPSCAVVMKSGNLNFLEPSGPLQACNGTDLPLPYRARISWRNWVVPWKFLFRICVYSAHFRMCTHPSNRSKVLAWSWSTRYLWCPTTYDWEDTWI